MAEPAAGAAPDGAAAPKKKGWLRNLFTRNSGSKYFVYFGIAIGLGIALNALSGGIVHGLPAYQALYDAGASVVSGWWDMIATGGTQTYDALTSLTM